MVIMSLKHETKTPRFIVTCMMNMQGRALIIAYAYFDANLNLKHYLFDGVENYKESPPDEQTERMLRFKLKRLYEITEADKNGKKTDV